MELKDDKLPSAPPRHPDENPFNGIESYEEM